MNKRTAVVFPGQGSQFPGMANHLATADSPQYKAIMGLASDVLGWDIERMCREGSVADLRRTSITQPAIYVVSVLTWNVLAENGLEPILGAGHSLGEYSALAASGSLTFEDGLKLVALRGRLMEDARAENTGMLAVIGCASEELYVVCRSLTGPRHVVEIANDNSPTQVVLSGHNEALAAVAMHFDDMKGVRCVRLPVGGPFHSSLMADVASSFRSELARTDFATPQFPVIGNVMAQPMREAGAIKDLLVDQITSPVRWRETMEAFHDYDIDNIVEVGPGRVLSGLGRQSLVDVDTWSTASRGELETALTAFIG